MPRFRYVAMDSKGAETEGVLDAESQSQAISMIRSKGFFPTRVVEVSSGQRKGGAEAAAPRGLGREIKLHRFFGGGSGPSS